MEFVAFLKARKKIFLLPVLVVALLLGALVALTQGSAIAPFIYAVF